MLSRLHCLLAGLLIAGACATGLAQAPDDTRLAAQALAPGGELRVGINLGNPVLAALAAGASEPTGLVHQHPAAPPTSTRHPIPIQPRSHTCHKPPSFEPC